MGLDFSEIRKLKVLPDSDDIKFKEIIKNKLLNNEYIIYFLNNKELQDSEAPPDDYYGVNILPYYIIEPTQSNVQNYICFETQVKELHQFDKYRKLQQIIFYILCEERNIIEKNTYFARHDLLGALILDEFNWSNCFGERIHCVSNIASTTDKNFAIRTIIFETLLDNNYAKTRNGTTLMMNHDREIQTTERT